MLRRAIVRIPGSNFADGLTTAELGVPHLDQVLEQHAYYCDSLQECGLDLTILEPNLFFPDSTFVEDTAILTPDAAILCRPGAPNREGEVEMIRPVIERFYESILTIAAPGTVDGGDVCQADDHFLIGISLRTNEEGARQLIAHLTRLGYTASEIDIRSISGLLHLKSGISYIGDHTLVVIAELASHPEFARFRQIQVSPPENYAANCIRVNDRLLVAQGFPYLVDDLADRGFNPFILNISEFRKMDGGLSCLSLRF